MTFVSIRHISFLGIIGMFYLCRLVCNTGFINGDKVFEFDLPEISFLISSSPAVNFESIICWPSKMWVPVFKIFSEEN